MEPRLVPTPRTLDDVEVVARDLIGQGWGKLERFHLRHRRFDGTWSEIITRDLYTISEVTVVLPYDPALDAVLLIEQFRTCGLYYNEPSWLIEAVAGIKPEGESAEDVARREAKEEAGCDIANITRIASVFASPGGHGEKAHLFAAKADLSGVGGIHGLAEEHEDIRAMVVPLAEAAAACFDGRILDVKTILMIQWLSANKHLLS